MKQPQYVSAAFVQDIDNIVPSEKLLVGFKGKTRLDGMIVF